MKKHFDLAELQARGLPRAKASDFLSVKEQGPEAEKAMLAAEGYFRIFLPPGPCVGCGGRLGAKDRGDAILGVILNNGPTFVWGLAHGEGYCRECGYPARAHHEVPEVGRIQSFILQYHPDELAAEKPEQEEVA